MWWLVFTLPSIVWAYGPVVPPVPAAVVLQTVAAQALPPPAIVPQAIGECKPLVQCSVWYIELLARPQKTCISDVRGAVGLCCPDTVHVTGDLTFSPIKMPN